MRFLSDPFKEIQELGRTDGGFDQDHADDHFTMRHGECPYFSALESLEHALWLEQSDPSQLKTWIAALRAAEDDIVRHPPQWLLLLLLFLVGIIEFETGILFWKSRASPA